MEPTTATACQIISYPPHHATNFDTGCLKSVKCSHCEVEYRLDYPASEAGRLENYEARLRKAAQLHIDQDHPKEGSMVPHTAQINIFGIPD